MLNCLTALEARAIAYLITPEDWSIFTHIEIRIKDSVQHGGTSIIYGGKYDSSVINALRALGYKVTRLQYDGKDEMIRIDWSQVMCPCELECLKEKN